MARGMIRRTGRRPPHLAQHSQLPVDATLRAQHACGMSPDDEGRYDCPSCGEEIVIPVDISTRREQEYVEDCPVCCCPILLRIYVDEDGAISIVALAE